MLHVEFGSTDNSAPTVTISAPANGATFNEGDSISFDGTATDAEDGDLTANLSWTSNLDGAIGSGGSFSTSLSVGVHTITASVTDSGGASGSDQITITVTGTTGLEIIDIRIATSLDDAEESGRTRMRLTSSDLELVDARTNQTVGMRFSAVGIPQGATIHDAYVQFQVDETDSGLINLIIEGEDVDNALPFEAADANISTRQRTVEIAAWAPNPWLTVGEAGPDQRTPNIASVIQEIVDRPGWSSGNALVIIITGSGTRTAEAYDGVSAGAPLLHVEFTVN